MNSEGACRRLILAWNKKESGEFTTDDEALLTQLAATASLALGHVEARLRAESRERELETVFATMRDPLIVFDARGEPARWNPAAARAYGYVVEGSTRAELVSKVCISYFDGGAVPWDDLVSSRALRGESVCNQPLQFTTADGQKLVILSSGSPLLDDAGTVVGAIVTYHDITDHARAVRELCEGEERFRTLVEESPMAIAISRGTTIVYANPEHARLFGYDSLDEVRGLPFTNLLAPPYRAEMAQRAQRPWGNRRIQASHELVGLRKDGSEFPFQLSIARVSLADGPAAVAFFTDVTERKQAEAERERLLRQMQKLAEGRRNQAGES